MTDDQAQADLAHMPNVKRLLAARGPRSPTPSTLPALLPLAGDLHHRPVRPQPRGAGNFYPFGWYGMKHRANTLPAWLQGAGYRTALIGKWLNGYGARDAHGEVPAGFDIWRGLLVSAYDYYNFVMNQNGKLKTWGDADFARKLVEFAKIEVIPNPGGLQGVLPACTTCSARPLHLLGRRGPEDYSPDVTGKITEQLVRAEGKSKKPFFIWWSPPPPPRGRGDHADGPPRPRPAPGAPLRVEELALQAAEAAQLQRAGLRRQAVQHANAAKAMSQAQIDQLQLDYEGRIGSLLAVDDHVKTLIRTLKQTHQLQNTLIVFVSDNGWLQGEHRVTGDKFLPYEESVRIPLIVRGPACPPARRSGQVANIDFAPTLVDAANANAGRKMDGVSLLPTIRNPRKRPTAPSRSRRWSGCSRATSRSTPGTGPTRACAPTATRTSSTRRPASGAVRPPQGPLPAEQHRRHPAYARIEARLAAQLKKLDRCKGRSCLVNP